MSIFVEYGKDSRFLIKILTLIVVVESVVMLVMAAYTVKQRIVYVNPNNVVGTTKVGHVPDEYAAYFGLAFLSFLGNVNSISIDEQYKTAFLLMSPQLQSNVKAVLLKDMEEIKRSNMTMQVTPLNYKIEQQDDIYTTTIEAVRVSFVYGQETRKSLATYILKCKKGRITKNNPFGLEVVSYEIKSISDKIDNLTTAGSKF